ncbi:MAG: DNA-directed RNA polymerase subunit omega [Planctomycetota bacterium]|nr:MAG: DNA-directed RNA polymerase subunit omega [Planctomycetota bacterium]
MAEYKTEELIEKVGGRFMLVALLQKRVRELQKGARPLVVPEKGAGFKEIALQEIWEGKVEFVPFEPQKEERFDIEEDLFELPE